MNDTRLLTLKEAGEKLGVSPRTVKRLVKAGKLKGHRVSPRVMKIEAVDLEEYWAGCSGGDTSGPRGVGAGDTGADLDDEVVWG